MTNCPGLPGIILVFILKVLCPGNGKLGHPTCCHITYRKWMAMDVGSKDSSSSLGPDNS